MDKVLGDILKERFPDYPMELLSYTDKGTGWEVRVRLAKVHLVPVLSDGFDILISDRDVILGYWGVGGIFGEDIKMTEPHLWAVKSGGNFLEGLRFRPSFLYV